MNKNRIEGGADQIYDPRVADADTLFGATTRGLLIHQDFQGLIPPSLEPADPR